MNREDEDVWSALNKARAEAQRNPPAFPGYYGETQMQAQPGMDLRDWFAGQALAGYCANPHTPHRNAHDAAGYIYELADAMLAERAKGGER